MNELPETEPLLTKKEVCERLRVSPRTVDMLLSTGALPYIKVGCGYRIAVSDLREYLTVNRKGV